MECINLISTLGAQVSLKEMRQKDCKNQSVWMTGPILCLPETQKSKKLVNSETVAAYMGHPQVWDGRNIVSEREVATSPHSNINTISN